MEVSTSRRRVNTYGKAARKLMVHDLFDVATQSTQSSEPRSSTSPNIPSTKQPQPQENPISEDRECALQLEHELQAAVHHLPSSKQVRELGSPFVATSGVSTPSVFEIESSEDEAITSRGTLATNKRRKLISHPPVASLASSVAKTRKPGDVKGNGPQSNRLRAEIEGNSSDPGPKHARKHLPKPIRRLPETGSDPDVQPERRQAKPPEMKKRVLKHSQRAESPKSERSASSGTSTRSTPKIKRQVAVDIPSDVSSPSQLELSSLRFTPDRATKEKLWSLEPDNSDSSAASPHKTRRRLVDRLDVPRSARVIEDLETKDLPTRSPKPKKLLADLESGPPQPGNSSGSLIRTELERTSSAQSRGSLGKGRVTYGKQRSHLSDMVDGLESIGSSTSQPPLSQLASQVDSLHTLGSQFDLDDSDSDDQHTSTQLKNIHELRQAGAVNRSERDLESLLDDIEADSKALRLHGLMQLVRKLKEQSFKRYFLDSGQLSRLTIGVGPEIDLPTAMVMLLALWTLAVSDAASAKTSSHIYRTLMRMPPALLNERRPISVVAQDRKENLSKALVRDMTEFETHVLEQSMRGVRHASHIIIAHVSLRCFEFCLKKVVEVGELVPTPPLAIIDAILLALEQHVIGLEGLEHQAEHLECIRLMLSWLELTSTCARSGQRAVEPIQCVRLGQSIASIMEWARLGQASIQQSSLRAVVSLSNNDSLVCEQFASTNVMGAIFTVIEDHFLRLAESASQEKQLDSNRLDSVILALGCLLNFAECSEHARKSMVVPSPGGKSQVDKLVHIFNRYVDDTGEAVTIDQTQVMVAFGYLSMLLCTLCLDDAVRKELTEKIKGPGLTELYRAAETFLTYMRAVEGVIEGNESSSAFTGRFTSILETVKEL